MDSFEHYLYVARCADGSLYTGYATNVEARIATHNAGKGAKYTRARRPVTLLAKARFFTQHRAMSAEYFFKKLDRDHKEQLLEKAAGEPFEDVLSRDLPGFPPEPIQETIAAFLVDNQDPKYRDFTIKLIPNLNPDVIVGVRTPALRRFAKQLAKRPDVTTFLRDLPHALFEEDQIHSFILDTIKDYDLALTSLRIFVPFVNNWATCDQLPNKALMQRPEQTLLECYSWIDNPQVYASRYGMELLMQHYLDDLFDPELLTLVAKRRVPGFEKPKPASPAYYHNMMRAWFFAEAVAKQPQATIPILLEQGDGPRLDPWTRRKAVQKACESHRVPDQVKAELRASLTPSTPIHLVDAHMHLDLMEDPASFAHSAAQEGIGLFAATVTPAGYHRISQDFGHLPHVRVGLGLHPWWIGADSSVQTNPAAALTDPLFPATTAASSKAVGSPVSTPISSPANGDSLLEQLLAQLPYASFVGEIGLDFAPAHLPTAPQQLAILEQILSACAHLGNKVLTLHCVRAYPELLNLLQATGVTRNNACIIHWFSGTHDQLLAARQLGCWFSVGERLLSSKKGRAYVHAMPADRLLLETDAPPIGSGIQAAAHLLSLELGEDAPAATTRNALQLLNLI